MRAFLLASLVLLSGAGASILPAQGMTVTVPSPAVPEQPAAITPALINPGFECAEGYHDQDGISGMLPDGWNAALIDRSNPSFGSVQVTNNMGSCEPIDRGLEKLEGDDSLVIKAPDIETLPKPGKPFDAAIYQTITVTQGAAYSLSAWATSLCGGSTSPNDCPDGNYIAKMLGLDPSGGKDPLADSVTWVEDMRPHTTAKWVNLREAVTARSDRLSVFVRIKSPFQWHGNHAFLDAVKIVQAPQARFMEVPTRVENRTFKVAWTGNLGPDIPKIPGGNYHLYYDVQYRLSPTGAWRDWMVLREDTGAMFNACMFQGSDTYSFRVRARAEQPEGQRGAYPNHRFPGVWFESEPVSLAADLACPPATFLPLTTR